MTQSRMPRRKKYLLLGRCNLSPLKKLLGHILAIWPFLIAGTVCLDAWSQDLGLEGIPHSVLFGVLSGKP